MILIVLMYAIFAAIFPIGRSVVHYSAPFFFTGLRLTCGGFLLLTYHFIRYKKITFKGIPYLMLLTIFGAYFNNIPEMWALRYLPAAKSSFIYTFSPFISVLLSYFFFQEILTVKKLLSMVLGFVALAIMLFYDAPAETPAKEFIFVSWGELLMLFAAFSGVVGWIAVRKLVRDYDYSSLEINGLSMFLGGLGALVTSYFFESPWNPVPAHNLLFVVQLLVLSILCSNIIGYNLYGYLLRTYTTTLLALFNFIEPLFAAFYGWIFLGEVVSWPFFVASIFVFIGLYGFYKEEIKQGYVAQP